MVTPLGKLAKATVFVVGVLIWIQSASALPHWLETLFGPAPKHHLPNETLVRVLLIVAGLVVMLVALGPDRVKRWISAARSGGQPGGAGRPHVIAVPNSVAATRKRLRDFSFELTELLERFGSARVALSRYQNDEPRDNATWRRLGLDLLADAKDVGLARDGDDTRAIEAGSVAEVIDLFNEVS